MWRFSGVLAATLLVGYGAGLVAAPAADAAKSKRKRANRVKEDPEPSPLPVTPKDAPTRESANANPYLDQAREMYGNAQFEGIIPKLEMALAVKGLTTAQRIEIYKLTGFTYAAFDDGPKAEQAFIKLLQVDPNFQISNASPKIRSLFASAQKQYRQSLAVRLQHDPPRATHEGVSPSVDVQVVSGQDRVRFMTLHYRVQSESDGPYSQADMKMGDTGAFSAPVPNLFPGPSARKTIEYFIRARGAQNELLTALGDEANPYLMEVDTVSPSTPLLKSPWFWATAAAVVAASVAVPILISREPTLDNTTLGTHRLPLRGQ